MIFQMARFTDYTTFFVFILGHTGFSLIIPSQNDVYAFLVDVERSYMTSSKS